MGFPRGSDGKESACNMGDLGKTPGLGRSPGDGNGSHSSILPGFQRSLTGYSPWSHKKSDITEQLTLPIYNVYICAYITHITNFLA